MPQSERLLLGPGPSNPYPEAVAALTRPVLGHLDPEFLALLDETMERLRSVFRTKNALTLPISGTGSAGMEACFVNLLEPGDTAIVGVNGVFGERMADVARRCGADVIRVEEAWGRALDPQRLLDAQREHPDARLVAVVHAETSTGVENDIAPLAALGDTDTMLLVDTVTSLGGIPVEIDAWGVDVSYSGTQKCLGVPPGLGSRLVVPAGHRLPELTTAWLPEGADDATLRKELLGAYGIEVGGGLGPFAGQAWRIGLMGHSARDRSVTTLLGALRELLG